MTLALVHAGGRQTVDPRTTRTLGYQVGVPPRFTDCRLDNFEPRKGTKLALEAAARLADTPTSDRGLVLAGPPGTGKTHLAVGILAARVEAWHSRWPQAVTDGPDGRMSVRPELEHHFIVVPSLLDRLRAGVAFRDAEDPLPGLMTANLLVLDDLGREKSTDWAIERIYVLVNERYNHRLPTIVTTNYTPGELVARGYDALMSRLFEAADVVQIEATDFRTGGAR